MIARAEIAKRDDSVIRDTIPTAPKANITQEMRKEREAEGESFENVHTSMEMSLKSARSSRSRRRIAQKGLTVSVLPPEPPIEFDNDVLSVYSQTHGTISLDSVSNIETDPIEKLKKESKASVLPPTNLLTAKLIRDPPPSSIKAIPVSDAILCEQMNIEGPFTAPSRKGDVEMGFINQLIANVMSIVDSSGNTDLELKITIDREDNGLPKVKFELIPKARFTNAIERLNRAYVQYAKFHEEMGVVSDCETATSDVQEKPEQPNSPLPDLTQSGSRFSLLSVFNSLFTASDNQKRK
ncbi:hypothetical protein DICVIV_08279 [Dictyocaulus viviparus]|uniref:Uncharacterized protein n=1 Tax=Dictyocaulus viviparus TaxID=29172 RepID=A0A0D8XLZ0_DICVI|nr:hypothetical protein DICVIV_08279 [Dictyocaulus viviparus]